MLIDMALSVSRIAVSENLAGDWFMRKLPGIGAVVLGGMAQRVLSAAAK